MKRWFPFLPLMIVPAAGSFLCQFAAGARLVPGGVGFVAGAAFVLVLPWAISTFAFIRAPEASLIARLAIFALAMALQVGGLLVAPPGATSEMMGMAFRQGRAFPSEELDQCARRIRDRWRAGTLATNRFDELRSLRGSRDSVLISEAELPESLRGRFDEVFLRVTATDGRVQVYFSLGPRYGIVCDDRPKVRSISECSIQAGVHAYRDQRP